jgi:A/G-specific adenine glycosylase
MMELGATVCTPRKPDCIRCPANELCRSVKELDDPSVLPRKPPHKQRPHHKVTAGIIRKDGKLLIIQRPLDGLLGGLWEFPGGRCKDENTNLETCLINEVKQSVDITIEVNQSVAVVKHAFTHFEITLYGYYGILTNGEARPLTCHDCRWVTLEEMKSYAFSKAHNRLIDAMYQEMNRTQMSLLISEGG